MKQETNPSNMLYDLFFQKINHSLQNNMLHASNIEVEKYLANILVKFIHVDKIFAIRNHLGEQLFCVTDMLEEADVLCNADSFDRERFVHKHIADFILFYSGIFPNYLTQMKFNYVQDITCDYISQCKDSYYIVSKFDHGFYQQESQVCLQISMLLEDYIGCFNDIKKYFPSIWTYNTI